MQINIKLKFDQNNKGGIWQTAQRPFFLDNPPPKNKQVSPDKRELHSFRQNREYVILDDKQAFHTHREGSKDIQTHNRKHSTVTNKKSSKCKNLKGVSPMATDRKSSNVKRNVSDKIKMPKKKMTVINSSNFMEEETLRTSLPGLSGKKVLQRFAPLLSQNQKIELINEKTVYYIGVGAGAGQDDLDGTYLWKRHEQIGYRYELLEKLGSGAFGQVVKAYDHKNKESVAVKIIKSKKQHMQLALNEINILMKIKEKDIQNKKNILRIKDFIVFRKHICIITEILSMSLYQLLESSNFLPLQMHNIRAFAIQILSSLAFLKELNIIHSDLKPQNILLKNKNKVGVKIIDFGTSMLIHQTNFLYIQSRFYRAPQIILGANYDYAIDMWSFGCLLAQLYLGYPLFAGQNQQQQLSLIMKFLGLPPKQYLKNCKNTGKYFGKDISPKIIKGKDGKAIMPSSKSLFSLIPDKELCEYLQKILLFNPTQRLTPLKALIDPWILEYFPQDARKEHINQIIIKIKKQESNAASKKKSEKVSNSDYKQHKKRNSQFHMNNAQMHHRRGSGGIS